MTKLIEIVVIFASILCFETSAFAPLNHRRIMRYIQMSSDIAVVGLSGGTAETVAYKLSEQGSTVTAVMDKQPVSPLLQAAIKSSKVKLVLTEKVETPEQMSSILSRKIVVVIGDEGDDELRGNVRDGIKVLGGDTYWDTLKAKETEVAVKMLDKTLAALPKTISQLVCVVSAESTSGKVSTLDFKNPFSDILKAGGIAQDGLTKYSQFCASNQIPFSAFRYGQLTGGVSGADPLPFLGLPAAEPELHPSYVYQGVVLTSLATNQYASTEICTRNALAEAIVRKVTRGTGAIDALVVSIIGNVPTEKDWETLFTRMQTGSNVELLRMEFGEMKKPAAFATWLVDSWFPQALIDADAATILTGARPVRARKVNDSLIKIVWEEMAADLSVKSPGGLDIIINGGGAGTSPYLSVIRATAGGSSLPGEMSMVDKLLEGINKNAFKRNFASPAV